MPYRKSSDVLLNLSTDCNFGRNYSEMNCLVCPVTWLTCLSTCECIWDWLPSKAVFCCFEVIFHSSLPLSPDETFPPSVHIISLQLSRQWSRRISREKLATAVPTQCQTYLRKKWRGDREGLGMGMKMNNHLSFPPSNCDSLRNCQRHCRCFPNLVQVCWVRSNISH